MKRLIALLLTATLLLGLCACGGGNAGEALDEASLAAALAAATSASSDASEPSDAGVQSLPDVQEPETVPEVKMAADYVTLEETETEYGLIQIPQIDEEKLDSEDVRLANAVFQSIRDWVLERVADCKKELGDEPYHDAAEPICAARYTLNGDLLSMTVKFIGLYPYSTPEEFFEAVSVDVSTGKVLDPHDVIKAAGYTEDEVKAALRSYTTDFMFFEWEHSVFYSFAADEEVPDGLGDPSYAWQEELDKIEEDYDASKQPFGEPWDEEPWQDALPLYPTVYAGEAGLELGARVPTAAGAGTRDTMIFVGHNDSETIFLNPNTPSGTPFGQGAILSTTACEAVAQSLRLDDDLTDYDGVQYGISAESMEIIETEVDEQYDPAYVIRVYTDEGDHIATVDWYAVGVFTGTLWKMDTVSAQWVPMMNGTGPLPEELVTGAEMNGALAAIMNDPSGYLYWVSKPCTVVDMTALASGSEYYGSIGETLLLYSRQDDLLVSFETGIMEGDGFIPQTQLWSVALDMGECVAVLVERPQVPDQAIIVRTADDVGTYIIQYHDPDNVPEIEYITSDFAVG